MTPKNKAEGLVDKMLNQQSYTEELYDAKQCALIAVDEIIKSRPVIPSPTPCDNITDCFVQAKDYWQQVKIEIEKL
jgi:hypothetical protein